MTNNDTRTITIPLWEGPRTKYQAARRTLHFSPREIMEGLVNEYVSLAAQSIPHCRKKQLEWAWTVSVSRECVTAIDAERQRHLRFSRTAFVNHLFDRYLEEWASTQTPRITHTKPCSSIDLNSGQYRRIKNAMESSSCTQDETLLRLLQFAQPCPPRQSFAIMHPSTRQTIRSRATELGYESMADLVRNALDNAPEETP